MLWSWTILIIEIRNRDIEVPIWRRWRHFEVWEEYLSRLICILGIFISQFNFDLRTLGTIFICQHLCMKMAWITFCIVHRLIWDSENFRKQRIWRKNERWDPLWKRRKSPPKICLLPRALKYITLILETSSSRSSSGISLVGFPQQREWDFRSPP